MKNLIITSLFTLLFMTPIVAQEKMQKSVKERATEKVFNLDKELKLSDAQKKELQVYFEEEMNQMTDTRVERIQEHKKMEENRQQFGEKQKEMRERRATQKENITERRESRMERMQKILTPEQYETWLKSRQENKGEFQRNGRARSEINSENNENSGEGKRTRTNTRGKR